MMGENSEKFCRCHIYKCLALPASATVIFRKSFIWFISFGSSFLLPIGFLFIFIISNQSLVIH